MEKRTVMLGANDGIAAIAKGARPLALGALARHFDDQCVAEESIDEACLFALRNWPLNGPPATTQAPKRACATRRSGWRVCSCDSVLTTPSWADSLHCFSSSTPGATGV